MTSTQTPSVGIVEHAAPAAAMLHPIRSRILCALRTPGSATTLSKRLEVPRQKINYHLRELERHGLVELLEERRKGNCTERILRTAARSWVISPAAVGELAADPDELRDRFSSSYLTALASRAVRDLGTLRERANRAGKRLATLSVESEVRFASAAQRNAFAEELTETVARLIAKYHDDSADGGRRFRLVVGAYPKPKATNGKSSKKRAPKTTESTGADRGDGGRS